jgi:hypothetical protein
LRLKLLGELFDGHLADPLAALSCPDLDRPTALFLFSHYHRVVDLTNLSIPDLLIDGPVRLVDLNLEAKVFKLLIDLFRILSVFLRDCADQDLSGAEPERPLPS